MHISITIADPELSRTLSETLGCVDLKDTSGRVIGQFIGGHDGKLPPGVKSPFTDEEMARRRQDMRPGRALNEILADLQARG